MVELLASLRFLLEQTGTEKQLTMVGVALFAMFMVVLLMDSIAKNRIMPKNLNVKLFVAFLLILSLLAIILLTIYYI